MSFAKKMIVKCDICGLIQDAKVIGIRDNETSYGIPDTWKTAPGNNRIHLCPRCVKKLMKSE